MNTTFTAAVKAQSLNCTTFFEKNYKPIFRLARGCKKILKNPLRKLYECLNINNISGKQG